MIPLEATKSILIGRRPDSREDWKRGEHRRLVDVALRGIEIRTSLNRVSAHRENLPPEIYVTSRRDGAAKLRRFMRALEEKRPPSI
jgi:hypothetical protein